MKRAEFIKYFRQFYGPKGLYPFTFRFTNRQVELCIELRGPLFAGDSIDREAIRDMLLVNYNQLGGAFEAKPPPHLRGGV